MSIVGKNTDQIKWIADGVIVQTDTVSVNGVVSSTIKLADHSDDISCYVRAELNGKGGTTLTQAFVCDDGNMDEIETKGPFNPAPVDVITVIRSFLKMIIRSITNIVK